MVLRSRGKITNPLTATGSKIFYLVLCGGPHMTQSLMERSLHNAVEIKVSASSTVGEKIRAADVDMKK